MVFEAQLKVCYNIKHAKPVYVFDLLETISIK